MDKRFATGVVAGSLVLAAGAGFGTYSLLAGGTVKAGATIPPGTATGGGSAPTGSPGAVPAAGSASCTIGASGHEVQVTVSGSGTSGSTCAQFGRSLAQQAGGFWQAETPDLALSLVCVMDLPGGAEATVLDAGGEIIGRTLCQDLQAAGDLEDTAAEARIIRAQQSALAAAAAASQSAAAAAAQQSKDASDYAQAQSAMNAISSDTSSLSTAVHGADQAVGETGGALKQEKADAAAGAGQYCGNADTVDGDADGVVGDEDGLAGDPDSLSYDLGAVRSDDSALEQADAALNADGVATPPGAGAAIAAGTQAVNDSVAKANADIDAVAADVTTAYQVADTLATGSCSGSGPGSPPNPPAHLT